MFQFVGAASRGSPRQIRLPCTPGPSSPIKSKSATVPTAAHHWEKKAPARVDREINFSECGNYMCTQCTYRARPPHDQLILSLSLCLFLFCTREMIRHPYISQSTRGGDYPLSPLRLARTHINNAYTYPRLYVCVARGSGKRAVNKSVVEINPPIRAWHSQTVTGRSNVIKRIADRIKTISLSPSSPLIRLKSRKERKSLSLSSGR